MTVTEVFAERKLVPCNPAPWMTRVPELKAGVYVVARVNDPNIGCQGALSFVDPLPTNIRIDFEYENQRWLSNEPVVYIGKTDQPLSSRIAQFYRQICGASGPHAGGQIVKLLRSALWVYWSSAEKPYETEQAMLSAFKMQAGQVPFANWDQAPRPPRIVCPQ
jgi:hypothetical protein